MNGSAARNRPALPHEVREVFGDLDDLTLARIVGTGATPAEVAEAHTWLLAGDALAGSLGRPRGERVAAVIDIVQPEIEPPDDVET